ncbi:hypothetical protein CDAR_37701 [Caerostris darwini]|uniref:Uncharacterized protein n=1 Tax=Caerostris darwini TaxID=1538125 RepID=A0AAV4V7X9_9ARAC|nr:hypothetical protein CDAR_37701 [Caerostris darwini]
MLTVGFEATGLDNIEIKVDLSQHLYLGGVDSSQFASWVLHDPLSKPDWSKDAYVGDDAFQLGGRTTIISMQLPVFTNIGINPTSIYSCCFDSKSGWKGY